MIFFDIDGTLVNDQKNIPESTKLAIKELKKTVMKLPLRLEETFLWLKI